MAILTSVDTLPERSVPGTIHAIATKPIARWQVLIGKWIGFAGMVSAYVAFIFGGTVAYQAGSSS
jgi:Cu-processing system permease protein